MIEAIFSKNPTRYRNIPEALHTEQRILIDK